MTRSPLLITAVVVLIILTLYTYSSPPSRPPRLPTKRSAKEDRVAIPQKAYAIFVSSSGDYVWSAIALIYQLRKFDPENKVLVLLLTNNDLTREDLSNLRRVGGVIIQVDRLSGPMGEKFVVEKYHDQYTKLMLWSFTDYDQIVYLDADHLLVNSMQPVFQLCNTSPFCAVGDPSKPEGSYFNAGMFVVRPDLNEFDRLITFMGTVPPGRTFPDQDMLNDYFRDKWVSLPSKYNAQSYDPSKDGALEEQVTIHDRFWEEGQKSPEAKGIWKSLVDRIKRFFAENPSNGTSLRPGFLDL